MGKKVTYKLTDERLIYINKQIEKYKNDCTPEKLIEFEKALLVIKDVVKKFLIREKKK